MKKRLSKKIKDTVCDVCLVAQNDCINPHYFYQKPRYIMRGLYKYIHFVKKAVGISKKTNYKKSLVINATIYYITFVGWENDFRKAMKGE